MFRRSRRPLASGAPGSSPPLASGAPGQVPPLASGAQAAPTPLPPLPPGRSGLSYAEAGSAALSALAANKLRAALTALGIFIGVAAVIVTVAVGAGARQQVLSQIQSLGANLLLVWGSNVRMGGVSLGAGQRPNMSWDDAQAIPRENPGGAGGGRHHPPAAPDRRRQPELVGLGERDRPRVVRGA
jgi:hypothetical protein